LIVVDSLWNLTSPVVLLVAVVAVLVHDPDLPCLLVLVPVLPLLQAWEKCCAEEVAVGGQTDLEGGLV
jgi:hypothetical protein